MSSPVSVSETSELAACCKPIGTNPAARTAVERMVRTRSFCVKKKPNPEADSCSQHPL